MLKCHIRLWVNMTCFMLLPFSRLVFRPLRLRVVATVINVLLPSIFSPPLRAKHLLFIPVFITLKSGKKKKNIKDNVFVCVCVCGSWWWAMVTDGSLGAESSSRPLLECSKNTDKEWGKQGYKESIISHLMQISREFLQALRNISFMLFFFF